MIFGQQNFAETYKNLPDFYSKSKPENNNIDPENKLTEEWMLTVAKSFMGNWTQNRFGLPFNDWANRRSFWELRRYASGDQPTEKYKKMCLTKEEVESGQAYSNVSYDPPRLMPFFLDIMMGLFNPEDFDIQVLNLDLKAALNKQQQKNLMKFLVKPEMKKITKEFRELGIETEIPEFDSEEDVDAFFDAQGFKDELEIALRQLWLECENQSDWVEIALMIFKDLLTLSACGTKDYEDNNGNIRTRYVDPEFYITGYSRYNDSRTIDRAGEIRFMTMSELSHECELTPDLYQQIAKSSNSLQNWVSSYDRDKYFLPVNFDQKIAVLDLEFISPDVEVYKEYFKKSGAMVYKKMPFDFSADKLDDKERRKGVKVERVTTEYVYSCKHIVGTNIVFDYKKTRTLREGKGNKQAKLNYHFYSTKSPSMVERCIRYIDDLTIATIKLQQAFLKLPPPPRVAIDQGSLQETSLGGVKMNQRQLLSMFGGAGYLIVQSLDDHGDRSLGATSVPIRPIGVGIMEDYRLHVENIGMNIGMIRQVTGVNEVTDATTPPSRRGFAVSKMAYEASKNSLKAFFRGYESILKQTVKSVCKQYLLMANDEGIEKSVYDRNEHIMRVIQVPQGHSELDFDVIITPMPTQEEKMMLIEELNTYIQLHIQNGGMGGISPADKMPIYQAIKVGNLSLAQLRMKQAYEKGQAEMREYQMQLQQANSQANAQAAQAAEQAKQQTKAVDTESKIVIDNNKAKNESQLQREEAELKGMGKFVEKEIENMNI